MDLVINQTDGYLFSGRDFLPRVQIRLTITTDEPSPKAFILELQIICGTYIRAYMWRLPDSNIGFSDPIPSTLTQCLKCHIARCYSISDVLL